MPALKETTLYPKLHLEHLSDGFASGYFLAIMLYCTMILTMIGDNDIHRLKAMDNMKNFSPQEKLETEALARVKCDLLNQKTENSTFTFSTGSCSVIYEDGHVYLYLKGTQDETILLYYDSDTCRIIEWEIR